MDIIIATQNPSKALQIQELFSGSSIRIITLAEAGIESPPDDLEDGETAEENSLKKAWYAHERANDRWTMADDTALYINALNGEPGIYAARWKGEGLPDLETTRYCLERMDGVSDRSARFEAVAVLVSPEGETHVFTGEVTGYMREEPRVLPQPKMPYSCLFVPEGEDLSWAEMDTAYENEISHRGKAFRKARAFLEAL